VCVCIAVCGCGRVEGNEDETELSCWIPGKGKDTLDKMENGTRGSFYPE